MRWWSGTHKTHTEVLLAKHRILSNPEPTMINNVILLIHKSFMGMVMVIIHIKSMFFSLFLCFNDILQIHKEFSS